MPLNGLHDSTIRLLPTVGPRPDRDLARGVWGYLIWAIPIAELVVASALGQAGVVSKVQVGILLVVGTAGFGGLCLANAIRCNRTHCWIDGTLLPALAVFGGLNLLGELGVAWTTYLQALWGIVIVSFLAECVVGPRLRAAPHVLT